MKNIYSKMRLIHCTVLSTILLLVLSTNATAQVVKGFTQRTSTTALPEYIKPDSNGKIYNLRGDFKMAGNTNLTFENYTDDANNSSNLKYVDIDLDGTTINSSSSFLDITNDACTEIVYAGLYWSGRASTGSQTFNATNSTVATGVANNASNEKLSHNSPNNGYYNLEIIRQGSSNPRNPLYRFNFEGTVIEFNFTNNSGANRVQYRYGTSGAWTPISGSEVTGGYNTRFTFTTPFVVSVNGRDYKINYLNRDNRTNRTESQYRDTGYGYAEVNLKKITTASVTKTLNKREVLLKKEGGTYQTITANTNDIQYPNGSYANMYAAYADVTEYVRANKGGNYFVANLATSAGSTDNTGYFGGWGLVVIYANPNMKWRDITVFDGYAYVVGGTASHQLPISGFTAAQSGDINVDIGVMAGEGDRSISGDYFQVLGRGGTITNNNHYKNLGNSSGTGGFFNSNIDTGSTKNPNLVNNTGIDIQRIALPNQTSVYTGQTGTSNYIIGNSATSTTFKYGSTQDTYIIYSLVFAVDAYIPEVEGVNKVLTSQTTADINNLQPGDEVTYTFDVYNYGSDFINNAKVDIDIPNAMKLVSYSMQPNTQAASGAQAPFSFSQPEWVNPSTGVGSIVQPATLEGGLLRWTLGTIPTQVLVTNLADRVPMATLTYTLKVTNNCLLLQTSKDDCAVKPSINGTITGTGNNSGENLSTEFIKGYNTDCNNTPIYGGIDMQINPSQAFLTQCSLDEPIQGETRIFKKFCSVANNEILRSEIVAAYIGGTKFYSTLPTDPNPVEVTGNFPVNSDGSQRMFYAVLPGANQACFYQLATQLDVITQTPTISNVDVCFEVAYILNPTATGQDPSTSFYYFINGSTTPLTAAPQPTKPGVYTYQVALGKVQGTSSCFGPKSTFTITIRNCKTPVNPMIYTPLNR